MIYQFQEYKPSRIKRGHLNMGGANPQNERIDVNSLYIERAGKPYIGVMGEYHFSRAHREDWKRELSKMKAGGVTIVATYLFWIYHEETEGQFDFSGDLDIRAFIETAADVGLDVVIRIGPWAHGECRNGGFPDWLVQKPFALRDNNEEYMAYARIWYTKIFEQVKGTFYQDGGNVIAIQFENELVDNAEHLLALKKLALDIGYKAPIYTVTGWNSRFGAKIPVKDTMPVFAGYAEAPWANGIKPEPLSPHYAFNTMRNDSAVGMDIIGDKSEDGWRLPYEDYPYATCELGAGLQSTHHRRILLNGMDAYALSLVKLGCGNNLVGYYMYHGGTNRIGKYSTFQESKATGYPNDVPILSYDFHTALGEYGETREQYGLLNILHLFVNDFGEILAPMESVAAECFVPRTDLKKLRYCMRTDGKSGFIFVNHYQRMAKTEDVNDVVFQVNQVTFPSIDVKGDVSFFMPFGMKLGSQILTYATAQPLCRAGNVYFFAAPDGIAARYRFEGSDEVIAAPGLDSAFRVGDVTVVTVTWQQAKYVRKLSGRVYVGESCDIYEEDKEICCIQDGSFAYAQWDGTAFAHAEVKKDFRQAEMRLEEVQAPYAPEYISELEYGGKSELIWKKITVDGAEGFLEFTDECDVEQIYADGKLIADHFYDGEAWRVPAKLLYGKACYLVYTPMTPNVYFEYKNPNR